MGWAGIRQCWKCIQNLLAQIYALDPGEGVRSPSHSVAQLIPWMYLILGTDVLPMVCYWLISRVCGTLKGPNHDAPFSVIGICILSVLKTRITVAWGFNLEQNNRMVMGSLTLPLPDMEKSPLSHHGYSLYCLHVKCLFYSG